jgi:hypothetical protein
MTVMPPKMTDLMKAMNSQMTMPAGSSKGAMMSGSSSGSGMMSTNKMPSNAAPSGGMTEKSTMTGNSEMNGKSSMMSTSSSGISDQMAMMPDMSKTQSMIIGGALLGHVIYGAVLGSVVTALIVKTRKGEAKISR